jgi:hypothetical protein
MNGQALNHRGRVMPHGWKARKTGERAEKFAFRELKKPPCEAIFFPRAKNFISREKFLAARVVFSGMRGHAAKMRVLRFLSREIGECVKAAHKKTKHCV